MCKLSTSLLARMTDTLEMTKKKNKMSAAQPLKNAQRDNVQFLNVANDDRDKKGLREGRLERVRVCASSFSFS